MSLRKQLARLLFTALGVPTEGQLLGFDNAAQLPAWVDAPEGGGGSSPTIVPKASNQLLSGGAGLDDDDLIVTCAEAGTYRITGNIRSDGASVALWRLVASGVTIVRITGSVINSGGAYMIADKDPTGDDYIAGIGGDSSHDTNSSFVDQSFFDVIVTVTGTGTLTVSYYYDVEGSAPTIQAGSTLIYERIS